MDSLAVSATTYMLTLWKTLWWYLALMDTYNCVGLPYDYKDDVIDPL